MKNEVAWQTPQENDFPMKLVEKGLDLSGKTAFFFYFAGFAATMSMGWVSVLSVRLIYMTRQDASIPQYYFSIALACLAISVVGLYSFYKLYMDRRAYRKEIEIDGKTVHFKEITRSNTISWQEKLKKYSSVTLRHYSYRGVDSWYIVLDHKEKQKNIVMLAPDYDSRLMEESEKRKILAQYGTKFGLLTTYEKKEEPKEEAES